MKLFAKLIPTVVCVLICFGCSRNYYNVPRETFEKNIRTIGVAHLMVDPESDIRHPDKNAVVGVVAEANRNNEKELVALLRQQGGFFVVQPIEDEPAPLFSSLLFRRERRDDAGVVYNKYFYKTDGLREMMTKNNLDAVMLVVVSGLTRSDKVYSSTLLASVTTDLNYLIMTAQIYDRDGNILWEYPNFRQRILSYSPLLALQYPDFDEATANESDAVEIHFKTVPGIARAFAKTDASSAQGGTAKVSTLYFKVFADMVSYLGPETDLFGTKKETKPEKDAKPEKENPQGGEKR